MAEIARGSCLCGAVRYEVPRSAIGIITTCYCSRCRKSHGAERRLRARVKRAGFRWLAGEETLTRYALSGRRQKLFCGTCGTPILNVDASDPDTFGLAVATLDDDPGSRNKLHLFAASRPDWIEIRDDLPTFDTAPDVIGRIVELRPGEVAMEADGYDHALVLRVSKANDVEPGDRVRAHLPHGAEDYVLTREG